MRGGKRDALHADVRDYFRRVGLHTWDTGDVGAGFPDLVVQHPLDRTVWLLVEVKSGPKKRLTRSQREAYQLCRGTVFIIRSIDDVVALLAGQPTEAWRDGENCQVAL